MLSILSNIKDDDVDDDVDDDDNDDDYDDDERWWRESPDSVTNDVNSKMNLKYYCNKNIWLLYI